MAAADPSPSDAPFIGDATEAEAAVVPDAEAAPLPAGADPAAGAGAPPAGGRAGVAAFDAGAEPPPARTFPPADCRDIAAFWLLGLINNSSYVIMIAGAKQISDGSVALVYLAGILPTFIVKLTGPYWFHYVSYGRRLLISSALMVLSFVIVAFGGSLSAQLFGVALSSAQSGIGEASFLAMTSYYDAPRMLTAWSSGTGFAGVFGFTWVVVLNDLAGCSFAVTLMLANVLPVAWIATFYRLLDLSGVPGAGSPRARAPSLLAVPATTPLQGPLYINPASDDGTQHGAGPSFGGPGPAFRRVPSHASKAGSLLSAVLADPAAEKPSDQLSVCERARFIATLWPFMVPLCVVYFSEYAMQTGAWSAIGFPVSDKDARDEFYGFAGWCYQAGVFISRSSGTVFRANIKALWVMPLLQAVLLVFFMQVAYHQILYGWGLLVLCFAAGLLGGGVYVNGFTLISATVPVARCELALSAASLADTTGIIASDVAGLFLQACVYEAHNITGAKVSC